MNRQFKSVAILKAKPEKREELKNALLQLIPPRPTMSQDVYITFFLKIRKVKVLFICGKHFGIRTLSNFIPKLDILKIL